MRAKPKPPHIAIDIDVADTDTYLDDVKCSMKMKKNLPMLNDVAATRGNGKLEIVHV